MLLILVLVFVVNSGLIKALNDGHKDIFLLAGQSNMAGRGGVRNGKWNGNVPPECKSNPSVLRLNARLQWEVAHEPLHSDIDEGKACGVGPGMAFANAVHANGSGIAVVGLVPCAVGGTKLSHWEHGKGNYNLLLARANAALKEGGRIRALLWYQGESDTVRRHEAEAYKRKMESFIQDLRSDLMLPSLPVIQVALASGEGPFVEIVREAQKGIRLNNETYVNAKGLGLKMDHLHLTTQSQVRLGHMLAHSFLTNFMGWHKVKMLFSD